MYDPLTFQICEGEADQASKVQVFLGWRSLPPAHAPRADHAGVVGVVAASCCSDPGFSDMGAHACSAGCGVGIRDICVDRSTGLCHTSCPPAAVRRHAIACFDRRHDRAAVRELVREPVATQGSAFCLHSGWGGRSRGRYKGAGSRRPTACGAVQATGQKDRFAGNAAIRGVRVDCQGRRGAVHDQQLFHQ